MSGAESAVFGPAREKPTVNRRDHASLSCAASPPYDQGQEHADAPYRPSPHEGSLKDCGPSLTVPTAQASQPGARGRTGVTKGRCMHFGYVVADRGPPSVVADAFPGVEAASP